MVNTSEKGQEHQTVAHVPVHRDDVLTRKAIDAFRNRYLASFPGPLLLPKALPPAQPPVTPPTSGQAPHVPDKYEQEDRRRSERSKEAGDIRHRQQKKRLKRGF